MTHPDALTCIDVHKRFPGEVLALDGLDLHVPRGAFFGLLGPNGAGKTTLIRSIVGLTTPDRGEIRVMGVPAHGATGAASRRLIGYAPQDGGLDRFVTVRELLRYHGRYFGMTRADAAERADAMLEAFDLTGKADVLPNRLSGGMRRRLLLARALVHRPPLVILDEPTAGVDVELRLDLWEFIRALNADGTTILLTTHYLEEAETLCDRVAFIRDGRIAAQDTPEALRARFGAGRLEDIYLRLVGR
ncbi:MAG: ABC transporter ATP-binding protein [Thermoleophilia bacterium]